MRNAASERLSQGTEIYHLAELIELIVQTLAFDWEDTSGVQSQKMYSDIHIT